MWNLISEVRSRVKVYQSGGIASSIQLKAVRYDAAWRFDPLLMGLGRSINVIRCQGTREVDFVH